MKINISLKKEIPGEFPGINFPRTEWQNRIKINQTRFKSNSNFYEPKEPEWKRLTQSANDIEYGSFKTTHQTGGMQKKKKKKGGNRLPNEIAG